MLKKEAYFLRVESHSWKYTGLDIGCVSVPAKYSRKLRRFKIAAVVIMKVSNIQYNYKLKIVLRFHK